MIRRSSGILPSLPGARIRKGDTQAMTNGAQDQITLGVVDYNRGSAVSTATANALTALIPGCFLLDYSVWTTGGAAGERSTAILVNGTTVREPGGLTAAGRVGGSMVLYLPANAVLTLRMYVAVASVSVQGGGPKDTGMALTYLGAA